MRGDGPLSWRPSDCRQLLKRMCDFYCLLTLCVNNASIHDELATVVVLKSLYVAPDCTQLFSNDKYNMELKVVLKTDLLSWQLPQAGLATR